MHCMLIGYTGSMKWIHSSCLSQWLQAQYTEHVLVNPSNMKCEICLQRYRCAVDVRYNCTSKGTCSLLPPACACASALFPLLLSCFYFSLVPAQQLCRGSVGPCAFSYIYVANAAIFVLFFAFFVGAVIFVGPFFIICAIWVWISIRECVLVFRKNYAVILVGDRVTNEAHAVRTAYQSSACECAASSSWSMQHAALARQAATAQSSPSPTRVDTHFFVPIYN